MPLLRILVHAALVLAALCTSGCLKKDYPLDGPVIDDVELTNAERVDPEDVLARLSTAASPRFLGIWDGVLFEYEVFDEALLARDLERIERFYRARGYYEAKVTAARVLRTGDHHVAVEIRVHEGDPVKTVRVVPTGLERVRIEAATAAVKAITLAPGEPFDEAKFEESKQAVLDVLGDYGYAFARIRARADVDISRHEAVVRYEIDPGKPARYGKVEILGLDKVPEGPVRANLYLEEGAPFSRAELEDARTALINLGVFASVDVRADRTDPDSGIVPVTVFVQESALRTLRLGGGTRLDVLEWSSHLTIGWEHRNFLGGMRRLSIDTKPGVVFFPTRMDNLVLPTDFLPKNNVRAELRQPSFIEGRTTGFLGSEYNIYPVLYPDLGPDDIVIGFQEVKARAGAERAFFGHHLYLTPSYNWQANFPFAYVRELPAGLDTVVVSFPELRAIVDFRDDPIEPHRGVFLSNTVQVAGYVFQGDASDVRVSPEVRGYVPISKKTTLAARLGFGFLFPSNYGETLQDPNPDPEDPGVVRDQQLLLFRAFYSGGPNSNRGYPFRGVGPHGILGLLVPSTVNCQPNDQRDECLRPLGGLTLWEASLEARFPLFGPLRAAIFVDASDVTREIAQIRFGHPHLSPGAGLRYETPVGPVRLDVGYRLPFAQEVGEETQRPREGNPDDVLGVPIAVHFGLGEAY